MSIRYERDGAVSEEYSDEGINVGCVSSWSINDVPKHRTVVNVITSEGFCFNSDVGNCSDERLKQLINRLRQAEYGTTNAERISQQPYVGPRAVRAHLRDYEEEAELAIFSRPWDPPKWKRIRNM
jgi:hypothetical protein